MRARERISELYRRFGEVEAPGRSPFYVQVAARIAADPVAIDFLAQLPEAKSQPNLLLGAVRTCTEPRSTLTTSSR